MSTYAFVEFIDHYSASLALTAMNGRTLFDRVCFLDAEKNYVIGSIRIWGTKIF